jgi:aminoglycoside phosphotransferase (APT) family kinase protein
MEGSSASVPGPRLVHDDLTPNNLLFAMRDDEPVQTGVLDFEAAWAAPGCSNLVGWLHGGVLPTSNVKAVEQKRPPRRYEETRGRSEIGSAPTQVHAAASSDNSK